MNVAGRRLHFPTMPRIALLALLFAVIITLLMLWLVGAFHEKIGVAAPRAAPRAKGQLVPVERIRFPRVETAVGTVRAVHETAVASKLLARVVEVNARAGQRVKAGELLVRLDDADLRARAQQAEAAVDSAWAARDQARIEFDRLAALIERRAAARIEYDRAESALRAAEAEVQRAEQARTEATTILDYALIQSPLDGIVVDKRVDVGDTVTPGQVLLTLYDPDRMQLIASVRESLTHRLKVGEPIGVRLDALDKTCEGRVSEIVPEAESASRTFSVKVTGPCPPGIYSGMFGRLLIPLDDEELLVIPRAAVRQVGQVSLVDVGDPVAPDETRRRAVQIGRTFDDRVEVLSGLAQTEFVALPAAPPTPGKGSD